MIPIAKEYDREELITKLRDLADEIGHSPRTADLRDAEGYPPVSTFIETFGSWNAAKEAARLETFRKEGRGEPFSDEELLALLRELDRETDGTVTIQEMNDAEGYPSAVTYQRRFGSWNEAKAAAGLETVSEDETPVKYSDGELLGLLRTLSNELDHPVRVQDIEDRVELPDISTFERRFGSWNRAKELAGLETVGKGGGKRDPSYSDDELLEQLRQFAEEIDGPVTKDAVNAVTELPAASTYIRRFGSMIDAKREAGIEENR